MTGTAPRILLIDEVQNLIITIDSEEMQYYRIIHQAADYSNREIQIIIGMRDSHLRDM